MKVKDQPVNSPYDGILKSQESSYVASVKEQARETSKGASSELLKCAFMF